jgi:hypothetical protein
VEALLGEVMTTCEKIRTINAEGEAWLKPEYRKPGPMMVSTDSKMPVLICQNASLMEGLVWGILCGESCNARPLSS